MIILSLLIFSFISQYSLSSSLGYTDGEGVEMPVVTRVNPMFGIPAGRSDPETGEDSPFHLAKWEDAQTDFSRLQATGTFTPLHTFWEARFGKQSPKTPCRRVLTAAGQTAKGIVSLAFGYAAAVATHQMIMQFTVEDTLGMRGAWGSDIGSPEDDWQVDLYVTASHVLLIPAFSMEFWKRGTQMFDRGLFQEKARSVLNFPNRCLKNSLKAAALLYAIVDSIPEIYTWMNIRFDGGQSGDAASNADDYALIGFSLQNVNERWTALSATIDKLWARFYPGPRTIADKRSQIISQLSEASRWLRLQSPETIEHVYNQAYARSSNALTRLLYNISLGSERQVPADSEPLSRKIVRYGSYGLAAGAIWGTAATVHYSIRNSLQLIGISEAEAEDTAWGIACALIPGRFVRHVLNLRNNAMDLYDTFTHSQARNKMEAYNPDYYTSYHKARLTSKLIDTLAGVIVASPILFTTLPGLGNIPFGVKIFAAVPFIMAEGAFVTQNLNKEWNRVITAGSKAQCCGSLAESHRTRMLKDIHESMSLIRFMSDPHINAIMLS